MRPFIGVNALGPSFESVMNEVKKYSSYRTSTDRRMSLLWLLIPISSIIFAVYLLVGVILTIESIFASLSASGVAPSPPTPAPIVLPFPFNLVGLGVLEAISVIPSILFLYFMYLLIKRRNLHFERQNRLFYFVSQALIRSASSRNIMGEAAPMQRELDFEIRISHSRDKEKSAVLWAILLIVPIVGTFVYLYILYFLSENFQKHEASEILEIANISQILHAEGVPFSYEHEEKDIRYGRFGLYFVLTLLTLGIFVIFWDYVLITGPNKHFKNQANMEDALLPALSSSFQANASASRTSS